jgi:hypothetical protein
MALKVHLIMQDARDFDNAVACDPVYDEMAAAPAVAGNMQNAEARQDVIAQLDSRQVRTLAKFADGCNERVPVKTGLSRTEFFRRPSQNVGEVEQRLVGKSDTPFRLGHQASFSCLRNDVLGNVVEIAFQLLDAVELLECAAI